MRSTAIAVEEAAQSDGEPSDRYQSDRELAIIRRALGIALRRLPGMDQQLLRHYVVLGLSTDELSRMYGMERAGMTSHIAQLVQRLRNDLCATLMPQLGHLEPSDLESWLPALYPAHEGGPLQ